MFKESMLAFMSVSESTFNLEDFVSIFRVSCRDGCLKDRQDKKAATYMIQWKDKKASSVQS